MLPRNINHLRRLRKLLVLNSVTRQRHQTLRSGDQSAPDQPLRGYRAGVGTAAPIGQRGVGQSQTKSGRTNSRYRRRTLDRKSTRLNSSHVAISYAVFCLKKKTKNNPERI